MLTKTELELIAKMLDMAAEDFGNHVCNDLALPNTPENRAFIEAAERWNSAEQWNETGLNISPDGKSLDTSDFFVMAYLSARARQESEGKQ